MDIAIRNHIMTVLESLEAIPGVKGAVTQVLFENEAVATFAPPHFDPIEVASLADDFSDLGFSAWDDEESAYRWL